MTIKYESSRTTTIPLTVVCEVNKHISAVDEIYNTDKYFAIKLLKEKDSEFFLISNYFDKDSKRYTGVFKTRGVDPETGRQLIKFGSGVNMNPEEWINFKLHLPSLRVKGFLA